MTRIFFNLDDEIYADIIAEIRAIAPTKSLGKIMPRILIEWYLSRSGQKVVTSTSETGQNEEENSLADRLSSMSFE